MLGLDLSVSINITQDNIEILDGELEDKRVQMTFRDFGRYSSLKNDQQEKLKVKMRKWIDKCKMREIRHNEDTGDLVVEAG